MRNWYDRLWGPAFAPIKIKGVSTETGDNMNDANYYERRIESLSTQVERLTTALDAARKEAEYWHRRFFMTDCYEGCDPRDNGWRPLKWDADGKAIYTEPPVEDEDDIVAAAERLYERENDTPTEPRSDLD